MTRAIFIASKIAGYAPEAMPFLVPSGMLNCEDLGAQENP
jgi:hypothetical protein